MAWHPYVDAAKVLGAMRRRGDIVAEFQRMYEEACQDPHDPHLSVQYRAMARRHGLDPRPSAIADLILLGGPEQFLRARKANSPHAQVTIRLVRGAVGTSGRLAVPREYVDGRIKIFRLRGGGSDPKTVRHWQYDTVPRRSICDSGGTGLRDLVGLRAVTLVSLSTGGQRWERFSNTVVASYNEEDHYWLQNRAEMARRYRRRLQRAGKTLGLGPMPPDTQAAIRREVGKSPNRVHVVWKTAPVPVRMGSRYQVKLIVAPNEWPKDPLPDSPLLPPLVYGPGVSELALAAPDLHVIPLRDHRKLEVRSLLGGQRPAGEPNDPAIRPIAEFICAEPDYAGICLVLEAVDWKTLDRLWPEIRARRRLMGRPTRRDPERVPRANEGRMLGRYERARCWSRLAEAGLTTTEIREQTVRKFPKAWICAACNRWWLHAASECHPVGSCDTIQSCFRCSGAGVVGLKVRATQSLKVDISEAAIDNEIEWFQRQRRP